MVIDGAKQQCEPGEEMNLSGSDEDGGGGAIVQENEDANDSANQTSTSSGDSSIPALISPSNRNPCHDPASDSPDGNNEVIVINAENLQNDGSEVESVSWSQASTVDIATVAKANTSASSNEGNNAAPKANISSSSNEGNKTITSLSSESSNAQTLSSLCSVLSSPKSSGTDANVTRSSEYFGGTTIVKETQLCSSSATNWSFPDASSEEEMFGVRNDSRKPLASTPTENFRVEFSEPLISEKNDDDNDEEILIPPSPNAKSTSPPPRVQNKSAIAEKVNHVSPSRLVDDGNDNCETSINAITDEVKISELANRDKKSSNEPSHPLPIIEHPGDDNFLGLRMSVDNGQQLSITEITDNNSSAECSISPVQRYGGTGEVTVIFETSDEDNKDTPPKRENALAVIEKAHLSLKNPREKETQLVPYIRHSMTMSTGSRREDLFAPLRLPDLNFQRVMQDIAGPSGCITRNIPSGEGGGEADSDSDSDYVLPDDTRQIFIQNMKRNSPYFSKKGKGRGKRSKPSIDSTQTPLSVAQNATVLPYSTTTGETTPRNSRSYVEARGNCATEGFADRETGITRDVEAYLKDNAEDVEMNDILDEICAGVVAIQNRSNRSSMNIVGPITCEDVKRTNVINLVTHETRTEEMHDGVRLNCSKSDNLIKNELLVNPRLLGKSSSTPAVSNAINNSVEHKTRQIMTKRLESDNSALLNRKSNAANAASIVKNLQLKIGLDPNATVTRKITTTIITKKVIEEEITSGELVIHRGVREVEESPLVYVESESGSPADVIMRSRSPVFSESGSEESRTRRLFDRLDAGGKRKTPVPERKLRNEDGNNGSLPSKITHRESRESTNCRPNDNSPSYTDDDDGNDGIDPSAIRVGSRVMAKWIDGYFYSGRACQRDANERWIVAFDDGNVRPAFGGIVAVNVLPVGMSVFAQASDCSFFEPGVILAHDHSGADLVYTIAFDTGNTKIVSRSAVMMSWDQISCLQADESPNIIAPGINLGNIVDNKRRHKLVASEVLPCGKKTAKNKNEDNENKAEMISSRKRKQSGASDDNTPKSKHGRIEDKIPPKLCSKTEDVTETIMSPALVETVKPTFAAVDKASEEVTSQGPHSPQDNIFAGKKFLLTEASTITHSTRESSPQDSSPNTECKIVFSKPELSKQISAGGGAVINDLSSESDNNVYLIANSFVRTGKYLKALALGIPCVSYLWIVESCRANYLLPHRSYLLPAGLSLLTGHLVEWHGRSQIFAGCYLSVFLSSSDSECGVASFWINLLRMAGAEVGFSIQSPPERNVDAVIIDDQCPIEVLRQLTELRITTVTTEWVIQCLTHGQRLCFDAHEKFTFK